MGPIHLDETIVCSVYQVGPAGTDPLLLLPKSSPPTHQGRAAPVTFPWPFYKTDPRRSPAVGCDGDGVNGVLLCRRAQLPPLGSRYAGYAWVCLWVENSAIIRLDLVLSCVHGGFDLGLWGLLHSEEVVAGTQVHGAPDARAVRWRCLHPRSDPRLANPRGTVVRFSLLFFLICSKLGRVPLLDAENGRSEKVACCRVCF